MSNDFGSTTIITAPPPFGPALLQRMLAATLYGKASSAAAVAVMLVLAAVEWFRMLGGLAPRPTVFLLVLSIAVLLAGGWLLRLMLDARSEQR